MDVDTIVWVRCGGRCAICNKYLLDDTLGAVVSVGENAHIVGREKTAKSPRGHHDLPLEERNKPENLVLLCRDQHKSIDNKNNVQLYTVEQLHEIKRRHEEWIRRVTEMRDAESTAVLRVIGDVRGQPVDVDRRAIASAVIAHGRHPKYPFSCFGDGMEIDLRQLPDEGSDQYYATARRKIDIEIDKFAEGIRTGRVDHVSLFAFARLPILIYLGHRLDDTFSVDIYQRHRATESWVWDESSPAVDFRNHLPAVGQDQEEAVLVVNASGTVQQDELPDALKHLPVLLVEPVDHVADPDVARNSETRSNFERSLRELLASLERDAKQLKTLHLFAAVPVSLACTIGRVVNTDVAPKLVVYELVDGERRPAMEIGR